MEQVCKDLNYQFSGLHVPESEVDNYGLAYGSFVPLLVKAIQELKMENGELKSQIHASRMENGELRMENDAQTAEIERLKKMEMQLGKITAALAGAGIAVEK